MDTSYEISVFDTVGSYFTDVYYTHICNAAMRTAGNDLVACNIEYKKLITGYVKNVRSDDKCYFEVLSNLKKYYNLMFENRRDNMSDILTTCMVPVDLVNELKPNDKEQIVRRVIFELIVKLGEKCANELSEQILCIRDSPANNAIIGKIQDYAVKTMCDIRNSVYGKFAGGVCSGDGSNSSDAVSLKFMLEDSLKKQRAARSEIKVLNRQVREMGEKENKYREVIVMLQKQIDSLTANSLQRQTNVQPTTHTTSVPHVQPTTLPSLPTRQSDTLQSHPTSPIQNSIVNAESATSEPASPAPSADQHSAQNNRGRDTVMPITKVGNDFFK